jgi:hypothetical protein
MSVRTVFLSHTSQMATPRPPDGRSFVDAALDAISRADLLPNDMRHFPAADRAPAQYCMDAVRQCDVYVGVFGLDYGSPVRDRPDVSYTELEFQTALEERQRRGMRVFAFLLKEDAALGPADARQADFRRRAPDSGLMTATFSTPDQLQLLVYQTIKEQLAADDSPALPARLRDYAAQMLAWKRVRALDRFGLELSARWGSERTPLSQLLKERPRLVLIGSPGGGKTVFLLKAFRALCLGLQEALGDGAAQAEPVVPVYAELAQLAPDRSLAGLILSPMGLAADGDALARLANLLRHASLVLFLDGLNELAEKDRYPRGQELLALHRHLRPLKLDGQLRVVVTTRPYGFSAQLKRALEDEDYLPADVLPLNPEEIEQQFTSQLPVPAEEAERLFAQIGPKLRHLLSNPQHLSYALEWYTDQLAAGGGLGHGLRTRGALLDHCIRKRLVALPRPGLVPTAEGLLRRLAYEGNNAAVYFSGPELRRVAEDTLRITPTTVDELEVELRQAELLLPSKDQTQFRFPHHSHQQYFAACEMKTRWRAEWQSYVGSELWHEPLVIMAGLLDGREVAELLRTVRHNPQLYAYVLANIDQPESERQFQLAVAGEFVGHVRFWARGMAWLLAALFVVWFLLVPLVAFGLHEFKPGRELRWWLVNFALDVLALLYVTALPVGMYRAYRRWFTRRQAALREQSLPRLLTVLKYLDSAGALRQIKQELESLGARAGGSEIPAATLGIIALPPGQMRLALLKHHGVPDDVARELSELSSDELRARLTARYGLRAEDPRLAFLDEALRQIGAALDSPSFMTEDEMLEKIADPLVAARMDVEQLSDHAIEYLMERAAAPADSPDLGQVLAKLRELYGKSGEHRERLAALFARLAADPTYPRWRRRRAATVCRSLGIPYGDGLAPRRGALGRLLMALLHALGLRR